MSAKRRLLVLTNVFPCGAKKNTGFYILEQVKRLRRHFEIKIIVAEPENVLNPTQSDPQPTVWLEDVEILQARYPTVPKIGVLFSGDAYIKAIGPVVAELQKSFPFDLIIAYWTYPEGFAGGHWARKYRVPLLIRPRGSDINVYLQNKILAYLIRRTLGRADKIIPVSSALKERIAGLRIPSDRLSSIMNGIELSEFFPMDQKICRQQLQLPPDRKIVIFAGNLIEIKGVIPMLEAIRQLDKPEHRNLAFYFLGKGHLAEQIRMAGAELKNVSAELIGDVAHHQLRVWMNAADLLCLPSFNEGCPNVVMESLACGLPVVASAVGGVPEILNSSSLGITVPAGQPDQLASAVIQALNRSWQKDILAKRVAHQSWDHAMELLTKEIQILIESNRKKIHG